MENVQNIIKTAPWQGLGADKPANGSIDEWKVNAGLDFKFERSPVQFVPNGIGIGNVTDFVSYPDRDVVFRSDNLKPLSIISKRYKLVQPADVVDFFRELVDGAGFDMETAGALNDGRRIWMLARVTQDAKILEADKIGGYLLLATSCDGGLATSATFTSIRVICKNTLDMAARSAGRIQVLHSTDFNPLAVKEKLGIAVGAFDVFMNEARRLAAKKVSPKKADEFLVKLINETTALKKEGFDPRKTRPFLSIMANYQGAGKGADLPEAKSTAWGLINAVTEYVDWQAPSRSDDARINSAWFGRGSDMKAKAVELIGAL
jgi:phage/plasmid-like protein (TIGR03299 family)